MKKAIVMQMLAAVAAMAVQGAGTVGRDARTELPERILRGYGRTAAKRAGNAVELACESAEKARLWAARYDHVYAEHRVRAGVYRLPGGGWTRLAIDGSRLSIVYSEGEPSGSLADALPKIPAFLNEWDDDTFRFYYRETATPPTEKGRHQPWQTYDPLGEFEWAKSFGHPGFVFWMSTQFGDYSYGMCEERWRWAKRICDEYGLPVVLNTNGDEGMADADLFRDSMQMGAPGFLGSFHGLGFSSHPGGSFPSWADREARRHVNLRLALGLARHNNDNVIGFLEPNGELSHGPQIYVFNEYGPVADRSFARFTGEAGRRLPEIAEFAGFGPDALDLSGDWKYRRTSSGLTNGWEGVVRMPGDDRALFLEKTPAEFERTFTYRKSDGGKVWAYVWDLDDRMDNTIRMTLNGQVAVEDKARHNFAHWMVGEVSALLRDGENVVRLELPRGQCGYKVYLTREEPKFYPNLSDAGNRRWVDFCAWQQQIRMESVEDGLKMMRQVEPDKSIVQMAPGTYASPIRELAAKYGTRFHDTGGMAVCDYRMLPQLMRSKGMPFSVEPGGPANDADGFRRQLWHWLESGVNAIHYFIHVGNFCWNPSMDGELRRLWPFLRQLGKWRMADTPVATLVDSEIATIKGYPWTYSAGESYPSGYWEWKFDSTCVDDFQFDCVTPHDFLDGNAATYGFVIDTNSSVMEPELAEKIGEYVRKGGTFFAMLETGRNTKTSRDRWLLAELAGVRTEMLEFGKGGVLHPIAEDVEVLQRDKEGRVRATVRKVGAGRIVSFAYPKSRSWEYEMQQVRQALCRFAEGKTLPVVSDRDCEVRHTVSNDGLYDGWWVFSRARENERRPWSVRFRDGKVRELTDLVTGEKSASGGEMERHDFRILRSLRGENGLAAWRWVENQFGYWRGGTAVDEAYRARRDALVATDRRELYPSMLDLTAGWDVAGRKADLAQWLYPQEIAETNYVCRRTFTVPSDWKDGDVELWATGMYPFQFCSGLMTVELNGKQILNEPNIHQRRGIMGLALPLKAGETAELAIKVRGDTHPRVRGFGGPIYLHFRQRAKASYDLAGEWKVYRTPYDAAPTAVSVPMAKRMKDTFMLGRKFTLPETFREGGRIAIDFQSAHDALGGVIVNGRYLRRHHHVFGDRTTLDVTPFVNRAGENEIFIVHLTGSRDCELLRAAVILK